jgi:hypothetical protein
MAQYDTAELSTITTTYIQGAEASLFATPLNALLNTIGVDPVISLSLSGGGDGHTFVLAVDQSSAPAGGGFSLDEDYIVVFYLASSADQLVVARAAAIVAAGVGPTDSQVDHQIAGSAKGTRFLGMIVFAINQG